MSTRSIIAKKTDKGYMTIYNHFDGFHDGVGQELVEDFNIESAVDTLIAKGDGSTPSTSYKDHGDTNVDARLVGHDFDYLCAYTQSSGGEYLYVWDNGWCGYTAHGKEVVIPGNTNSKAIKMTQNGSVLEHLRTEGCITPAEAEDMFDVQCLSARICELRKMGYDIVTRTEDGYSVYSL